MFQYTIRRLLLMIPTFLGATFMVFFILQIAPDGPFERAVKQLKEAQEKAAEEAKRLKAEKEKAEDKRRKEEAAKKAADAAKNMAKAISPTPSNVPIIDAKSIN